MKLEQRRGPRDQGPKRQKQVLWVKLNCLIFVKMFLISHVNRQKRTRWQDENDGNNRNSRWKDRNKPKKKVIKTFPEWKLKTISGKSEVVVRESENVDEVVRESEKVGNRWTRGAESGLGKGGLVVKGPMWKCGPGPQATLRRHWEEDLRIVVRWTRTDGKQWWIQDFLHGGRVSLEGRHFLAYSERSCTCRYSDFI